MDATEQSRLKDWERWEEMGRLFRLTPDELQKQSSDINYQRMRYERSIEGMLYIFYLRKGLLREAAMKSAREKADYVVQNWDRLEKGNHFLEG